MTNEELKKVMQYADEILDIVKNANDMTTSDLQGSVDAIVHKIITETKKEVSK